MSRAERTAMPVNRASVEPPVPPTPARPGAGPLCGFRLAQLFLPLAFLDDQSLVPFGHLGCVLPFGCLLRGAVGGDALGCAENHACDKCLSG